MEDEELDQAGTLGAIREQLGELLDPTTTEEAQGYARQFLDRQLAGGNAKERAELMTEIEKSAEEAREVLRAARKKLAARRYNPADRWFALSAALGAPTRVGGVGELAGRAGTALQQSNERERQFGIKQEEDLLGLDQSMLGIDEKLQALKLQQLVAQGKIDADLAKESLKTLGKRVSSRASNIDKAQQAVDREYAKSYTDWIQEGAPTAKKALIELSGAYDRLRGFKVGPGGERIPIKEEDFLTRQLGPTGRTIGTISSVPYVGKGIQDIAAPGSSDIRETVEYTVQNSLRPILGAQFTEKEGERLISRVYNTRLRREINASRLYRLINQLNEAYQNKARAAQWFETHGTMAGFQGKYQYTIEDFMPEDLNELAPAENTGNPDDDAPAVPPEGGETYNGRKIIDLNDLPKKKERKKNIFGFAEGGPVAGPEKIYVRMPDGTLQEADADVTQEDLLGEPPGAYDPVLSRSILAGLGAGAGYVGGKSLYGGATSLSDVITGNRETPAEARLLRLLEKNRTTPAQTATGIRRASRRGVPEMVMDTSPDFQSIAGEALPLGGEESGDLIDRLRDRQAGARERSYEQVNQGLKPDEYFSKEAELKRALWGDKEAGVESSSAPLYRAAEQQFPSVRSTQLGRLMSTPSGKKAVKAAMQTMKDRKKSIGKMNPVTQSVTRYNLEFLNQVKIEMDDMIEKAKSKGARAKAKSLSELRNAFRNEIDQATVDPQTGESPYRAARRQYEADKLNLDTLQKGREKFGSMQPAEIRKMVDGMNFEQKDLFRTGVAQKLREMLENPSTDINAARRLVRSPLMKSKLRPLFETDAQFKVFETALEKEAEIFETSRKMLQSEDTVRQRGAHPPEGVVARGARKAPTLGVFSPTYWALKYLRSKPQMDKDEAAQIIRLLKSQTPEELQNFERKLGPKVGRSALRKKRSGKAGMAGAAIGALLGAMAPDEERPELEGLTDEEKEWADTPAFAKGGKVGLLKEMIDKIKHRLPMMDKEQVADVVRNIAVSTGEAPSAVRRALNESTAPAAVAPTSPGARIPATPEQLAPYAQSMDRERRLLQQIRDSLGAREMDPAYADKLSIGANAADLAYQRMFSEPNPQNMQTFSELVRSLRQQAERRQIKRQTGGMTKHA